MKQSVSEKITSSLIDNGTILTENKELYLYGLQQGFFILLNLATTIGVGLIFGMFWQSIIFSIIYLPLRTFAGGLHTKTPLRCYVFSIVLIVVALLAIRLVPWNYPVYAILTIVSSLVIFILAPIEDENKPLDDVEKTVYKKKTNVILGATIFFVILFLLLEIGMIVNSIITSLSMLALMLVLGKIKNESSN